MATDAWWLDEKSSVGVVALVTLAVLGVPFAIVRRGERTMARQQIALHDRVSQQSSVGK